VGLEVDDLAERSTGKDGLRRENITLPTSVLKDGEEAIVFTRNADEFSCLRKVKGERFVDDNVLPGSKCCSGEREVALVWCCDDDEIDAGMRCGLFGGDDGDTGIVGQHSLSVAGANDHEVDAGNRAEQRSMEGLAGVAVAYKAGADGSRRVVRHWLCSPE
jgi:hypothetical protein